MKRYAVEQKLVATVSRNGPHSDIFTVLAKTSCAILGNTSGKKFSKMEEWLSEHR